MVHLADTEFHPCMSGALYAPHYKALLIADLHLEKGSSRAHAGVHLPPYDTRAGLLALKNAIDHWKPEQVFLLGDSFHDGGGPQRLSAPDLQLLHAIAESARLVWIAGNHDPDLPSSLPGDRAKSVALGPITLRHEPTVRANGEIAGHLHPVARLSRKGRSLRARCFVASPARIILPAFGAYTGGLNVRDEAFRPLLPADNFKVVMIGRSRLHTLPGKAVI